MDEQERTNKIDELTRQGPEAKTLVDKLARQGFKIMMAGFTIAAISAIVLIIQHEHHNLARIVSVYVGFSGFGIYVIGRILVAIQRKNHKKYLAGLPRKSEDNA